jgi:hypothetical protein
MWREIIPVLIVCSCVSSASAQEGLHRYSTLIPPAPVADAEGFDEVVVPISELRLALGVEATFGTGFCLDNACRFIGTNYHVAAMAQPHKIKGETVVQRYLASGPEDDGATVNDVPASGPMKYTLIRDLAIFELRHPLRHHHGLAFALGELHVGQRVEIYVYPKERFDPLRRLRRFVGTFRGETTTGLLAFSYSLSSGEAIRPGSSGGIVIDGNTHQIVGVLNGVDRDDEAIALAVPIQSLIDFVTRVQPFLAHSVFSSTTRISPVSEDLYPKFIPPSSDGPKRRLADPNDVVVLREKAQLLADSMRNFVAVQRLEWGSGNNEPAARAVYEVRVIDGLQRFRSYPEGKRELEEIPSPPLNQSIVPAVEWSELPEMVGTELRLKVHQAPDTTVNDRRMKIFQYYASMEDAICKFRYSMDYILFKSNKTVTAACYGEVWTDDDANIIRISEHYEVPGGRKIYHVIVTYGWLERAGEPPRLIPLTILAETTDKKRTDWCRGQFTDYQVFSSRVRIIANSQR